MFGGHKLLSVHDLNLGRELIFASFISGCMVKLYILLNNPVDLELKVSMVCLKNYFE